GPPVVTGARPAAPQRPRRDSAPVEQAVRWRVAPVYTVRARDLAPGVTRASVRFSCTVRRDGTLTACTARETPPGSGLAAATLPALANARMEPMLIDGRAVESVATLGVSYELSSAPPRPTPADAAAPAGPVEIPAAEPAPAPDPVPVDPAPPGPPAG
ncbi:energy transducer TonB, partial [Brevundimonas sp.]|uniref:energy transducer TonB n=1 Tax=Brevundimonas sp. TaxID=1871086 RepID=UPI002EDB3C35